MNWTINQRQKMRHCARRDFNAGAFHKGLRDIPNSLERYSDMFGASVLLQCAREKPADHDRRNRSCRYNS
jgi:hypothetical protein